MQQSTIFSILMVLLNKRKVSREYLAERFSISKRTVSRYLNVLLDAGVPITFSPGRGGGVSVADDYVLDKSFLSEAEMLRIKDALEKTTDSYGDKVNRAVVDKLESADKIRERDTYAIRQDDLFIDCDEQANVIRPKIGILSQAIENERSVDIKYSDAHGYVSFRTIDPYTIVFKSGNWYIYAMCRLRGDFRLFKISRIKDLRMTSRKFIKYESRLIEKLELEFYNELYTDIEFEFFPSVRESVIDWLGESAVTERGTKFVARAEVPMNGSLLKRLLSYGSSIRILRPAEIAEQLRDEAKRMLDAYEE